MSDNEALLAAILANPADDTARLVYADWLTENGQADRGEFIRIEIELAHTPPLTDEDERRRQVLHTRRSELLKVHKAAWLAPFLAQTRDTSFERGFVSSLSMSAQTFLHHAPAWFAITPLTRIKFTTCMVWDDGRLRRLTEPLLTSEYLMRLEAIDFERLQLNFMDVEQFAHLPDLTRLRELVLAWNTLGTDGARVVAGMPQLAKLESLDLVGNHITDAGGRAIAESPYLGNLKELRITRNPIRKKSWAALENRFGSALVG